MKKTTLLIFLTVVTIVATSQRVYYVQDKTYNANASDMNPGTDINFPWATWQRAFNTAQAGDTVYFRGGIWYPKTKAVQGYPITIIAPNSGIGHNGTHDNPICYFAYPSDYESGNFPILDCRYASSTTTGNTGIAIESATNIKFKGLTVRNVRMLNETHNCIGIGATTFETLYFENMTAHNIGGAGMWARGYDTVYYVNCDVYNCCDSLDVTGPGGDGDGFVASSRGDGNDTTYLTVFKGCRSWHNSDDGFDIGTTKQLSVSDCWSWENGVLDGDGTGFKFSYSRVLSNDKRWVHNCITAYNQKEDGSSGAGYNDVNLYDENYGPRMHYFNNVSYKDHCGFGSGPGSFECGTDPANVVYRNNISYAPLNINNIPASFGSCDYKYPVYIIQDHNTWVQGSWNSAFTNPAYTVTDEDFISLDTAQLRWPRKSNGSLPTITFMRPKDDSDLIDAGVDVGLPYNGDFPDIGLERYDISYPSITITTPINKSTITNYGTGITAEVSNASASKVEFFYDENTFIGQSESYPWSIQWANAPLGSHTLRAIATSSADPDVKATSIRINVTVIPGGLGEMDDNLLFPNPNDGSFILFLIDPLKRNSSVSIVSSDGKIVFKDTWPAELILKEFSLPDIASGVYILLLSSTEILYAKKFIKE